MIVFLKHESNNLTSMDLPRNSTCLVAKSKLTSLEEELIHFKFEIILTIIPF
jgi:heme/copper-type cytochrome/quinol oxidase subunit 4